MKVSLVFPMPLTDQPHRLFFQPDDAIDRVILERLKQDYKTTNFGIHAETGEILHVGIELEPKE